jgi:hypothetical protein
VSVALHFKTPRGPNIALNFGIFRVVGVFRFLFGVQVVQVAEEYVEAVNRRHKIITIPEVVLPELSGLVAQRFEQFGKGRVLLL